MNILVLGGTGRTGRHAIDQALYRGHSVTALIRSESRLPPRAGLRVVVGNPRDLDAVNTAIENQDAVISCLGQRAAEDATLLRETARTLTAIMSRRDVRRLIVVSQGLLFPSWGIVVSILRLVLARHVKDSLAMEDVVSKSALDWTIVRPPMLLETNFRRGYRLAVDSMPKWSIAMSRIDLATLLVDEVDRSPHIRAVIGAASA